MDLKKLMTRTLSGIIYCLIFIGAVWLGKYGVLALAIILSILACIEFAKICHELTAKVIPTLILDIAGCVSLALIPIQPIAAFLWFLIILTRFIEQIYVLSDHPLKDLSHSMMSQIYIGGPMLCMTLISLIWSPQILLAVFFFIWINDTGAFLVGSTIGKHRLFERISPKKSWEGFFGGLIFNIIFAMIFYYFGNKFFEMDKFNASMWFWIAFGVMVTVFSTWGDLIESLIKRNLHIKDSGNMIPGHGGILDRIDSLLLVLPATFLFLFTTSCLL